MHINIYCKAANLYQARVTSKGDKNKLSNQGMYYFNSLPR